MNCIFEIASHFSNFQLLLMARTQVCVTRHLNFARKRALLKNSLALSLHSSAHLDCFDTTLMAAKSAALLFSYMYSSLAAPYLLTCLGQFLRMLLRYSDHLNHLVNYSYWYWWRQLQRARMITRVLFIIQHTLRSCKLLLLFTAMLVLLCFEPAQDTKLDSYTSRSSTSVQQAFDLLTYLEQKLVAMTLHSAQLLQIHMLRSELSFTYRPVSWLMCSILMWYANYTFERTGCPDSISLTSIRQLLRL